MFYKVSDWDDAYANGIHIPNAQTFMPRWQALSQAFSAANPPRPLERGHLFLPPDAPRGVVVFIHGGYWMEGQPGLWSYLASGPLAAGWAVAMPAYTLAPQARIHQMVAEIAASVTDIAARIPGPIALTGHSAGGHLAARMVCDATLPDAVGCRITACVPISGLFDLRPLLRTQKQPVLALDAAEAAAESPALLEPRPDIPITTWVGGMERPEFIRQSQLLANIWAGLGAATECVIAPGLHHFDIFDGLTLPDSTLTRTLLQS